MADAPFDVARAHRWFAVEFNNLAWDFVENRDRSGDQVELMIHAAHAACFHWLQAGTPLNHLRAQSLLAAVYATAGYAESSLRHAEKTLQLLHHIDDEATPWDRACAFGCAALAHDSANEGAEALNLRERASAIARDFDSPEDLALFRQLFLRD